jgi:HlyD family secretion protein
MKRRTWLVLAGIVVVLAIAAVILRRPQPLQVEVAAVAKGPVSETVTNTRAGTIKACQRARLSPNGGGQIAKLLVKKGDRVRKGQVLLELWNEDARAQRTLAERDVKSTAAHADEACVTAEVAQKEARRQTELLKQHLVAQDAAEKAQGQGASTEAACRAAKEATRVSQARVDAAQASVERTLLRAPFDGTIAEINGELGEFVTPSPVGIPTPPAVDIVDTSCIYVTAPIDEVDAPRIRAEMPARVTLDAFRGRVFPAHVRRVAPYVLDVEKQARTVEVEAELEHTTDVELLPGYSADVEVVLDERKDVLRVPTRAVIERKRVYLYDPKEERVTLRDIKLGLGNWEYSEVLEGLKVGDRVVTSVDREGLKDGVAAVASNDSAAKQ